MLLIGNLDCEVTWGGCPRLPAAVVDRLALLATTLRIYARGDDDVLWLPAPVDRAQLPAIAGVATPILIATPGDEIAELADREVIAWGAHPAIDPSAVDIARAVNDRRFAHAIASELGVGLPGARTIASAAELRAHLAAGGADASPSGAWVAKAPLTAAGRERVRRTGALDEATATRVDRLIARHGALVFEPWLARTHDVGQGGTVGDGGVELVPPHAARCDAGGVIRAVVVDDGAGLEPGERTQLAATARAVGERLHAAGYRGPFVIDAFVHGAAGARRFHPLCEINARLTFGLVARAWAERRGAAIALGLGGDLPPGGEPLVLARDGSAAAWIAPASAVASDVS